MTDMHLKHFPFIFFGTDTLDDEDEADDEDDDEDDDP